MFVSPLSFFSNADLSDWHRCFARGGVPPPDKIRYILIIRVRFTTEFFSNADLSDWHLLRSWGVPTSDKIRYIIIIRVRFATEFFSNTDLSNWHRCFARWGTVFQTAVTICHGNPETSSRVTLASLGIGFQPNLMVVGHLWIKHQWVHLKKS